jgi:class 3 adenylate cyclase
MNPASLDARKAAAAATSSGLPIILATDVVGYSRLMEQDEAKTFERLQAHRIEFVEPAIAAHRGGIFKLMGDGLLAEFDLTSGGPRSIPN